MSGGGGGFDPGKELAQLDKDLSLSQNAPLIAAATAMYLSAGTVGGETVAAELGADAAATAIPVETAVPTMVSAAPAAAPAAVAAAPAPIAGAGAGYGVAPSAALGGEYAGGLGAGTATPGTSYALGGPDMVASAGVPASAAAPAESGVASLWNSTKALAKEYPKTAIGLGLGAAALMSDRKGAPPGQTPYDGPLNKLRYDPDRYQPLDVRPPTPYTPVYKDYRNMANGGIADLGGYSDGGRMLKGPGDGMSDSIPATIANKQPARLANEEFVVPADVVSHLGNGSSDAGAKQLYKMMEKVRAARTGKKAQAKQINPAKYMPA